MRSNELKSINITTINSRLDLCAATVWSLMQQTLVPDQINIWISKDKYLSDDGISDVPTWIYDLNKINNIVRVIYVNNTGPYRKIIPAIRQAKDDDILIYADDDVIYAKTWLEKLINIFMHYKGNMVVASRIREKKKNVFGIYQSYSMLSLCNTNKIFNKDFIITGVGGCVLSRKHILDKYIYMDDFLNVCPRADDIWISKIIELSGTEVICCAEAIIDVQEIHHSINALNHINNISIFTRNKFIKIFYRLYYKVSGYLGKSTCNNDLNIKSVDGFFIENQ